MDITTDHDKGQGFRELEQTCAHCWHPFSGAFFAVLRPGHVLMQCCRCNRTRQIHAAHAHERRHP